MEKSEEGFEYQRRQAGRNHARGHAPFDEWRVSETSLFMGIS